MTTRCVFTVTRINTHELGGVRLSVRPVPSPNDRAPYMPSSKRGGDPGATPMTICTVFTVPLTNIHVSERARLSVRPYAILIFHRLTIPPPSLPAVYTYPL